MTLTKERTTKRELFDSYRTDPAVVALRRSVRRPCACRGVIVADPEDPQPYVDAHNNTIDHRIWRRRREEGAR